MSLNPKVAQMMATAEGRRMLSAVSPSFFDSYYLNLSQAPHRKNWLETIEQLQKDAKETKTKKKLLVLSPRG
jgi:DNA-binding IclR family transcriptional regulator